MQVRLYRSVSSVGEFAIVESSPATQLPSPRSRPSHPRGPLSIRDLSLPMGEQNRHYELNRPRFSRSPLSLASFLPVLHASSLALLHRRLRQLTRVTHDGLLVDNLRRARV
ncbi:hypothetical protein GY45DRAFT_383523 [Cubamyces sp. BRFM 1775]|nr:hypothetical protein GY45DRAFT_383523 [Cubamyces sp. BRFM 1775]